MGKARARYPKRRTAPRTGPQRGPYYPNQVTTVNDLISALRHLRISAGQPSLLKLEQITAANGARLPRSTTSDLLRGKLRSPSLGTVLAFAQACGISDNGLWKWRDAWIRAMNPEAQPPRSDQQQRRPLLSKRQMRDRVRPLVEGYNGQLSDLAREMNTSIDIIRDILAARRRPSAQFARDLARVTRTPAEELLTDLGWLPARQPVPNGRRQ